MFTTLEIKIWDTQFLSPEINTKNESAITTWSKLRDWDDAKNPVSYVLLKFIILSFHKIKKVWNLPSSHTQTTSQSY